MFTKDPEGYRKLLAYQKAVTLQQETNQLVSLFPKTKTFIDLADQISRSGRSGTKNIVEGWKRNTTKEYLQFLGFAVGAIAELMEDCADIATGVHQGLLGIKGIMGERGPGSPYTTATPSAHYPLPSRSTLYSLSTYSSPFMAREALDRLRFYPLDTALPPIVQLFLKAKEVNYLLYRLQQSLDAKMDNEGTKPLKDKYREHLAQDKKNDQEFEALLKNQGLIRLENGQYVTRGKPRD